MGDRHLIFLRGVGRVDIPCDHFTLGLHQRKGEVLRVVAGYHGLDGINCVCHLIRNHTNILAPLLRCQISEPWLTS
eukprot:Skav209187  [mRNA]  locus=scaffold1137:672257:672484:- [translate_table: standard]